MKSISQSRMAWSRRETLKSGSLARLLLADPLSSCVSQKSSPMTANDGTDPCPIPWLDKNGSHNQPTNRSLEPSHIDRFKGRVARCNTFTGRGTGNHVNRLAFGSPTADFGAMGGENWAARTSLTTSQDGNTMTLETKDVSMVDQPRWPALDSAATVAHMSFKMVWKSTGEAINLENPAQRFHFTGTRASCQMEAQIDVPSIHFSWKSDPLETSKRDFAILGDVVNGHYDS